MDEEEVPPIDLIGGRDTCLDGDAAAATSARFYMAGSGSVCITV